MNSLKELITCEYCKEIYQSPIELPCRNTICQKDLKQENGKVFCSFCNRLHKIPKKGFPLDKKANKLIESNLIKMVENFSSRACYKNAADSINILESTVNDYEDNCKLGESFIQKYFSQVVNEIDLRKETLIKNITDLSEKLRKEVEELRESCLKNLIENVDMKKKQNQIQTLKKIITIYREELSISIEEAECEFIGKKTNELVANTKELSEFLNQELTQFEKIRFESSSSLEIEFVH